jgi:hypothetical protein
MKDEVERQTREGEPLRRRKELPGGILTAIHQGEQTRPKNQSNQIHIVN